mmetsp:Transcript_50/g.173  ORF Transcript_50/g.173 Transcript_50/m.173 type:complete len:1071 (+) Transcript_50:102-3314(+)
MALAKASALIVSATLEAASLVWMELAMFASVAVLYYVFVRGHLQSSSTQPNPAAKPRESSQRSAQTPVAEGSAGAEREELAREAHSAVIKLWQRVRDNEAVSCLDLSSVIDSLRKSGWSCADVATEIKTALDGNEALLPLVQAVPATLLRDDSVEMLDRIVALLLERGHSVDLAIHAGLMSAQLRRHNYTGVAATAARLPTDSLTAKMRAMLAVAGAHRGRLDEALGHLRQMPEVPENTRSALSAGGAAQVLALASREQRVPAAAEELRRIKARLEPKHLDELVAVEGRRRGAAACRELLEAGALLKVPRGQGQYQALVGVLKQHSDGPGLLDLIEELEAEKSRGPAGTAVGEPLALTLLEACRSLGQADLPGRVAQLHAAACAGAPGSKVLVATCAALVARESWEEALGMYERELAPKGVNLDAGLTGALLKAATQAGRSDLAQRLSDQAGSARSAPGGSVGDLQRQATLMKACTRERDLAGASAVFSRLRESGAQLTPQIYNCFLDACVQCGDVQRALAHFEEMKRLHLVDVVGYNTMLKAHLSRGQNEEALSLVKEMASRGLPANKVTYNELLHAKVIAKDRRGTWSLVDEMREAGVLPNSVTCSILLKSLTVHSHAGDVKRVIDLIDDVDESVDEVLFSSVIEACIRIRQLDLLSNLMRRFRSKGGFNLSAPTYGSMIKAYGQAGDIGRVRELWREMDERGVKPTSITLGCMAEALVVNGQADEAWDLIHLQLESDERRGCINTVIYSTVLKGFAVTRRIEKVFAVYQEMRGKDIPCNTITYNTMLDACAKCSAMDRASSLLVDMKNSSVEPDIITYSTIIKGYCQEGDVDRAFHVLEEMKGDDKFAPDEIMYNSILDGCAKQHRVEDALRILEEMKSAGVGPSNYTLSILVKLLGHARRLSQAFRMVEDLSSQNGFRPNVQVYTCLVQACVLNRRLERALALHDTMVADASCKVDEKFYAVLARGCIQLHQPAKAAEVVRAAYQLSGHSLAEPARREAVPVGVEARALEELAAKLQGGSSEEQEVFARLSADLLEQRGVRISECRGSGRGGGGKKGRPMPGRGSR